MIHLCGLGEEPPATITLDTLALLGRCPAVFVHGRRSGLAERLRPWLPQALPWNGEAALVAAARRGHAAVAFEGHPLIANPAGVSLERRLRALRLRHTVHGSNSALGAALAASELVLNPGACRGLELCDERAALAGRPLGGPFVVYGAPLDAGRLARGLRGRLPQRQAVWLSPVEGGAARKTTLSRLQHGRTEASWALIIPNR